MILERAFRRIYAIPDIHGALDLLDQALEVLDQDGYDSKQDLLVFLGDMIDRGPDSKGVLDLVISLQNSDPDTVIVIRGNHEDFAVDALFLHKAHAMDAWMYNGGKETLASYPDGLMSSEHVQFLCGLPYSLEAQGYFFSHAPVPREKHRNGKTYHGLMDQEFGSKNSSYNTWELTWHYIGRECEKPGGLMDVHEGPRDLGGNGNEHLIGLCGHIHRGPFQKEIRSFPKYRMLDCGAGCFPNSPLAIHECISNRTLYAYPEKDSSE